MSIPSPTTGEVLHAKKRPWFRRLWVRIVLVLMLIYVISLATWWWPRRTMVAVWRINGTVGGEFDRERARPLLNWWDPSETGWLWQHFSDVCRVVGWIGTDGEIVAVGLAKSRVDDEWLVNLQKFPNLQWIEMHDRQLGSGLEDLRGADQLKSLDIIAASNRHLVELLRLPQLEQLYLTSPQSGDIGVDVLTSLPNIKYVTFRQSPHIGELLQRLPDLPHWERLGIERCQGFTDEDLLHLQRLPNLKFVRIMKSSPISDGSLIALSKLQNVETLYIVNSLKQITEVGLKALQQMKKLKKFAVAAGDLSPEQSKLFLELLPDVELQGN